MTDRADHRPVASPRVERTGLLILRVRLRAEQPRRAPPQLVATITTTFELSARAQQEETLAGSVDEVVAAVRRWIEAFAGGAIDDDAVTNS